MSPSKSHFDITQSLTISSSFILLPHKGVLRYPLMNFTLTVLNSHLSYFSNKSDINLVDRRYDKYITFNKFCI